MPVDRYQLYRRYCNSLVTLFLAVTIDRFIVLYFDNVATHSHTRYPGVYVISKK